MKILKKINLGLVLTIIVVLAVVIYSINVEGQRKSSKEEIRKSCEEYIDLVDKYAVLPESAQVFGEDVKKVNLDDHFAEMEGKLKEVMISDSAASIENSILSDYVQRDLLNTTTFVTSYDKQIVKIKSYNFDGNQVTVSFEAKINIKQKYMDVNTETGESKERVKEDTIEGIRDTITLEKKDGKWKVVYSDLNFGDSELSNAM
ncbi:MAG: hypothetical protein IKE91_06465 [Clostridia bacterium]|nr:hypothetical protein [Clostridia bacterium]